MKNTMKMEIDATSVNEGFARSSVAAFALTLNPSLSELSDVKTAVSEAVTNCIVHAYNGETSVEKRKVLIECETEGGGEGGVLHIRVSDFGRGIEDVEKAVEPFFTTSPSEERSGMGFTIMQTFMDEFEVRSKKGEGTTISMAKIIGVKGGVNA